MLVQGEVGLHTVPVAMTEVLTQQLLPSCLLLCFFETKHEWITCLPLCRLVRKRGKQWLHWVGQPLQCLRARATAVRLQRPHCSPGQGGIFIIVPCYYQHLLRLSL
jgi:hypothetical protein